MHCDIFLAAVVEVVFISNSIDIIIIPVIEAAVIFVESKLYGQPFLQHYLVRFSARVTCLYIVCVAFVQ